MQDGLLNTFANTITKDKSIDRFDLKSEKLAFLADMDACFIFVPKAWLRQILLCKLIDVGTDLATSKKLNNKLNNQKYDLSQQLLRRVLLITSQKNNKFMKSLHGVFEDKTLYQVN